jgi:PPOX class probable F420-dependent enzyme
MAELTPEQEAFLEEPHVAVLASNGPGGQPHAVPIWFIWRDGAALMTTGEGSQKHVNLQRDNRATLVIDRRELPYYALILEGTVEIGPQPPDDLRRDIALRYLGEEAGNAYLARGTGAGSVTLTLRPDDVIEYRGRAGRRV